MLSPALLLGCAQTPAPAGEEGSAPAAALAVRAQPAPGFALCAAQCRGADYYLAYEQNNTARMGGDTDTVPPSGFQVLRNTAEVGSFAAAPRRTEARVEHENGNFTLSTTRIEALRVGFARKTESIIAQATTEQGGAESLIRLAWGDTLRVTSDSLPRGAAVTLTLSRSMGGFANPLTDETFYDVRSQTYIDGVSSEALNYSIRRDPGPGQTDQIVGNGDAAQVVQVRVGDVIRIEGLLSAVDGARSAPNSQQFLNGGDSAAYTLGASAGACVKSSSGRLNAGTCR